MYSSTDPLPKWAADILKPSSTPSLMTYNFVSGLDRAMSFIDFCPELRNVDSSQVIGSQVISGYDERNIDSQPEFMQLQTVEKLFKAFACTVPKSIKTVHRHGFETFVRQQNYKVKARTLWRIQKRTTAAKIASFKLKW
jgi:hypothetical protein